MALTTGSHPSGSSGRDIAAGGVVVPTGPLMALRVVTGATGKRSPLSVRLKLAAFLFGEGAAVVEETSSPMANAARAKAVPQHATRYRE
jgi:hypothetical protein